MLNIESGDFTRKERLSLTASWYVILMLVGAVLGALIASSKNLNPWLGAILGGLFSLVGLLILAVMPKAKPRRGVRE